MITAKISIFIIRLLTITFLILNYFNILQPLSGNFCKIIPIYLIVGIIFNFLGIFALLFLASRAGEEEKEIIASAKHKTNKLVQAISIIIFCLLVINGFAATVALFIAYELLGAIYRNTLKIAKKDLEIEV